MPAMEVEENMVDDHTVGEGGLVKITTEAIASIAAVATCEVKGVAELAVDLGDGMAKFLGRKNLSPGVKVALAEKEVQLTINLILDYGADISEVAAEVQRNVGRAVEQMTSLIVREVNVNIKGVKEGGEISSSGPDYQG